MDHQRRLPIGIQTSRKLREDGCYYVDMTHPIECLLEGSTHYFLSRPDFSQDDFAEPGYLHRNAMAGAGRREIA